MLLPQKRDEFQCWGCLPGEERGPAGYAAQVAQLTICGANVRHTALCSRCCAGLCGPGNAGLA